MNRGHGITDIDVANQLVDTRVMNPLTQLTDRAQGLERAQPIFQKQSSNYTELGAVLHLALCSSHRMQPPWRANTSVTVTPELDRFLAFADHVRAARWTDWCGTAIADTVVISLSGSDLGPRMASQALARHGINVLGAFLIHYVSKTDTCALGYALSRLDSSRTGFFVQCKTISTQVILMLADSGECGLTGRQDVDPVMTFVLWDWVTGRNSVWSSNGSSFALALAIGSSLFRAFLRGVHAMGEHCLHVDYIDVRHTGSLLQLAKQHQRKDLQSVTAQTLKCFVIRRSWASMPMTYGGELRKIMGRQINSQTTGA